MAFLISSLGPAVASERAGAAALEAFKSAICLLSAVIVLSWPRTAIFSVSFSSATSHSLSATLPVLPTHPARWS